MNSARPSKGQPEASDTVKPRRGDRLVVYIDRLSVGGRGVSRYKGLVIFVTNAAPNELLEIQITFVKKNYATGEIIRVVKPSPQRVTPLCPVAGVCGGCSWQQVSYAEQLVQKRALVDESLRKFAGFEVPPEVLEVVSSPDEFRYRNRIQLHHSGSRLGFYKRGSHEIIEIDDCPITESILCAEFAPMKKKLAQLPPGRVELYVNAQGRAEHSASTEAAQEDLTDEASSSTGPAFSQVNTRQNINLVHAVVDLAKELLGMDSAATLIELYAGGGNFTFPLARALPKAHFIASELNTKSVSRAREIIAREFAGSHLQFEGADAETWLRGWLDSAQPAPTLILLDPPRAGAGPLVMDLLVKTSPTWIIYISCHPVTLARDLQTLARSGFSLETVRPFDMFPQTDHVETLVLVKRGQTSSSLAT